LPDAENLMKTCFVISPIGEPGSDIRTHADDVYEFLIKPAAEKAGYVAQRADHDNSPGTITEQMYDHILNDDLVIAVLTFHNPNVFYEIAIAEAAARPLILLCEKSQTVPFDISQRRVIKYELSIRSFNEGTYVSQLLRSITEAESGDRQRKVPFRASLSPLGAGEAAWRMLPRSEDFTPRDRLALVQDATSIVWYQGLALFSFAELPGFDKAIEEAIARSVEIRVLLLDPENPALEHLLRSITSRYVDSVREKIRLGLEYWTQWSSKGQLNVRLQRKGVMFAALQLNDAQVQWTQYSYFRGTSDSASIVAPSHAPFYTSAREEFEWAWGAAEPAHTAASEPMPRLRPNGSRPRKIG
jgi:hypothetical protein